MSFRSRRTTAAAVGLLPLALASATPWIPRLLAAEAFETPPTLRASALLPERLRQGARFRVDEDAPSDGWSVHFTLRSDFGVFEAAGRELLEIRIDELAALARIEEVSRSEAFAESAKAAAKKPFLAVKAVVERPVETAKGIPAGVGRFAKRTYRKVRKGVHAAKDAKADRDARQREEEEAALAPGDAASQPSPSPTAEPGDERTAVQATGDVAKDVFGWSAARRAWARQLRIDPYTTNPVLSDKLDEVAWAAFAGGFAIGTVMPTLPGPVDTTTTVSELVWTLPPPDLEAHNEKRLAQMGIEGRPVRELFRNRHFTPTLQTALVGALEELRGVGGRRELIPVAAAASSEEEARGLCGSLAMLARLHRERPLDALYVDEDVVSGRTRANAVVLALADDYVSWTDEVAALLGSRAYEAGERGLWLRGRASPRATAELRARRWRLVEAFAPRR